MEFERQVATCVKILLDDNLLQTKVDHLLNLYKLCVLNYDMYSHVLDFRFAGNHNVYVHFPIITNYIYDQETIEKETPFIRSIGGTVNDIIGAGLFKGLLNPWENYILVDIIQTMFLDTTGNLLGRFLHYDTDATSAIKCAVESLEGSNIEQLPNYIRELGFSYISTMQKGGKDREPIDRKAQSIQYGYLLASGELQKYSICKEIQLPLNKQSDLS